MIWFVAKDVCDILEIKDVSQAVESLDADEKGISQTYTPGGKQNMTVINESGLYSLILSSKLDRAREFKHWVTSEVPSSSLSSVANAPTTSGLMRSVSDNRPFELRFQAPRVSRAILPW